jgi:GAF domain-containing protein
MREGRRLARPFAELSDTLAGHSDVEAFLAGLCQRFVAVMKVSAAGAVLTDRRGRLRVAAASTDTVAALETLEVHRSQGPCVDAYRYGRRVVVRDLRRARGRWPVFTPWALEAGVAAVCAFPMRVREDRIGALDVFHAIPGELDETHVQAAQALTDVATFAIVQARAAEDAAQLARQLDHALESRVVVEQAKGVLAERLGVDPDAAFMRLRRYGRVRGLRLAELARRVVDGSIALDE